jgi:eukaryotic translation initiation factor 2C
LIDLEAVIRFCKANEGSAGVEEECLTGKLILSGRMYRCSSPAALMATNVLLRDVPSKKYAQVGAAGNRFFSAEGAVPIAHGAVVCKGFMQ